MKTIYARVANFAILSVLLPFVYGCQGGSSALSFLGGGGGGGIADSISGGGSDFFTSGASGISGSVDGFAAAGASTIGSIAAIHQPEPATMLLLGSGLMAMAAYKKKNSHKRH